MCHKGWGQMGGSRARWVGAQLRMAQDRAVPTVGRQMDGQMDRGRKEQCMGPELQAVPHSMQETS